MKKMIVSAVQAKIDAWKYCLPGNLSNLFYYLDQKTGVQRFNNYFELGVDGIDKIIALADRINAIRIHMGCQGEGSATIFSPVLSLVVSESEQYFYELTYVKKEPSPALKISSSVYISPAIADLFQINWDELSDTELINAFEGVTYTDITNKDNPPATHRVNFYDFDKEDVTLIQECLKKASSPHFKLLLGAGLTVRLTHPFNFRPIIEVPLPPEIGKTITPPSAPSQVAHFERSRPCPPFCPDKEGVIVIVEAPEKKKKKGKKKKGKKIPKKNRT